MPATSQEELFEHLKDTLRFLSRSAELYDKGDKADAKNMALYARLLLHDTASSHSLLKQLNLKDQILFASVKEHIAKADSAKIVLFVGLTMGSNHLGQLEYYPSLGPAKCSLPIRDWLDGVIVINKANKFSRYDIIQGIANKDGGAHVDPQIPAAYHEFSRRGVGWENGIDSIPAETRPIFPAMRQIAHEILLSVTPYLQSNQTPSP